MILALEDQHFWANILMSAVLEQIKNNGGSVGKGMMRGGSMHSPDKEGLIQLNNNKRYVVVKAGKMAYYNCEEVTATRLSSYLTLTLIDDLTENISSEPVTLYCRLGIF